MKCPLCDVTMKEVERRGVLIDVCPECKGVWLDKGELDKLLAASREYEPDISRIEKQEHRPPSYNNYHEPQEHDYHYKKKRKRKSFFEDIFDIFD